MKQIAITPSHLSLRPFRLAKGEGAKPGQHGFTLISALFLLILLAVLGAAIARISMTQSVTSTQDLQGSRAYHAARAGIEWGVYQVMDPANATVAAMVPPFGTGTAAWPNFPGCLASSTTMPIETFSVQVNCNNGGVTFTEAGVRSIQVYQITAIASSGTVGSADYVERQIRLTVSKCRTTNGNPPDYACP